MTWHPSSNSQVGGSLRIHLIYVSLLIMELGAIQKILQAFLKFHTNSYCVSSVLGISSKVLKVSLFMFMFIPILIMAPNMDCPL